MAVKAVVYREHTLGLLSGNSIEVLRASVRKGASFRVHDSPFTVNMEDCRPATKQDFDDYRVHWHPDYLVAVGCGVL